MNDFAEGQELRIMFGSGVKDAVVVKRRGANWIIKVDLGGYHPMLTSMSPRQLQAAVDKANDE